MSHYSMVRNVNFLVTRLALIDLRGADASTSDDTISYTSYMGSVGAEIFLGVSQISSSHILLTLTPLERNSFSKKTPLRATNTLPSALL
jgi:hypothetical protein